MPEEKKTEVTEEAKEEARQLTEEDLKKIAGGDSRFSLGSSIMGADSAYISHGMKVIAKE